MIATLHGTLFEKGIGFVIIECAGVGYEVAVPLSTFNELPLTGEECRLFIRHIVREDDEQLFGFSSKDERATFDLLTSISGVGPRLALSVLDGLSVRDFRLCIVQNDPKRLSSIKGIGKKTAERIVVELKGRIDPIEAMATKDARGAPMDAASRDAILALTQLGFSQEVALKMVQAAIDKGADKTHTDALVRAALASR